MTRQIKLGIVFLALAISSCSYDPKKTSTAVLKGDTVGNGGHAVVCRDENGKIASVELLDFYEGGLFRDTSFSMGDRSLPALEKVKLVLDRIRRWDPERAARYQKRALDFLDEVTYADTIPLVGTNDYGYVRTPSYCTIQQICVQNRPPVPSLYVVNLDLWYRLDNDHRAGLILHEIVYTDALDLGQKDSVGTRRFVSEIASAQVIDAAKYQNFLSLASLGNSSNYPLVWSASNLKFLAKVNQPFVENLAPYLQNRQGDPVVFSILGGPKWAAITATGIFFGSPSPNDLGSSVFEVTVSTGSATARVRVTLSVGEDTPDASAPETKTVIVVLPDAKAGQIYMADLFAEVHKLGLAGEYRTYDRPAFLTWADVSTLAGTPSASDVGSYSIKMLFPHSGTVLLYKLKVEP